LNAEQKITLTGKEALDKLLSGKDVWNAYVEENPIADVDFSGIDFSALKPNSGILNCSRYLFPKGKVDFSSVVFGEGRVEFGFAEFGEGETDFSLAVFGKGGVSFLGTKFGEGAAGFMGTEFGDGRTTFSHAEFGKGGVFFNEANFGNGYLGFSEVIFEKGIVDFTKARFGNGFVDFSKAQFREGDTYFDEVKFKEGPVSFQRALFDGHFSIADLKAPNTIKDLSMRHCTFEKSLDLSGNKFTCIPDLTNTKLTNQLSLDRLECIPAIDSKGNTDPLDIERLCRLKELAAAHKNHDQALQFHVQEMRAKRYQLSNSVSDKVLRLLDYLFDITSEYGRSISKPAKWLSWTAVFYSIIYWEIGMSINTKLGDLTNFGNGLLYSLSQIIPFTASGKVSATESAEQLFASADNIPNWFYAISLSQGLVSFIFIFLLGLGLRNKFRI